MAMFFTAEKIHARVRELEPYRYQNRHAMTGWEMSMDDQHGQLKYPPKEAQYAPVSPGYKWDKFNEYAWLKTRVQIPNTQKMVLLFNFGLPGNLNQTGFEGLLFVDGHPLQGLDSNHEEVLVPDKFLGKTVQLDIKLWTGMYGRHGNREKPIIHEFKYADIAQLDPATDDLYFSMRNMIDTVDILSEDSANRYKMLNVLDQAAQLLDWQEPGSEEFYASIKNADKLVKDYLDHTVKNTAVTVTALGHTHIDLAWLWQLKHTREKAARSFATVLQMMDNYPDYVFLHTTPQLYAYIKQDYPEIFAKIKQRVAEGRWEIDGGMWVEADCNIPSGESLVRQIMFGTRFIQKEFNKRPHYLWLPDVFGYSWALPQILRKSGLDTFMTTKISWNEYNRMPNDTFEWKGIDGSEILTHFITTPDAGKMKDNPDSWFYTYNGEMTPSSVKGVYNAYSNKELNSQLLLAYGYGDGGGGVNRDMLESRRRLDKIPGLPQVKTDTGKNFFDQLHRTVNEAQKTQYIPTWDGELYLEFHRGTYTSHAYMKKMNRRLEMKFRQLEYDAVLNQLANQQQYPQESLNAGWTILLRNQFHDIIPGSAIHEVYEDCHKDYAQALSIAKKVKAVVCQPDSAKNKFTILNNQGWTRQEDVLVPVTASGTFTDSDGKELTAQKVDNGYVLTTPVIPATGSTVVTFHEGKSVERQEPNVATIDGRQLQTPFYILAWNASGQLTRVYDRQAKREILTSEGLGNTLEVYEDKPRDYDAWNIDLYYYQKKQILKADTAGIVENTPSRVVIKFSYHYLHSSIDQDMILYKNSRRIDFKTKLNWQDHQKLLKAGFTTDVRSTEARYQIQFGNLKRTTTWNNSWDWAKFETVGHQWADLSEQNYGVALLNDSKYGYAIKGNRLSITLLKSAISPDPEADIGQHEFTYSLLPHEGNFVEGSVEENAWALNSPLQVVPGEEFVRQPSLFETPAGQVLNIDAVKKAEDSDHVIVRFHDHTGGHRVIKLAPTFECSGWREVNLLEESSNDEDWHDGPVELTVKPYEIKTLEFRK
ncbi:alpha-mannosidase [Levilactobacillus zymae]|uniref:alpha-mannosidase n=1 Tax=Levilactobacillus zymae TaxID=267363 RepID=UPI0028BAA373|nr:alpha-mannosidase [Levilactobacillus zymae]MDT6979250.1 alpha-mannosidase [Levilactobacillus zymae]